MTRLAIFAHYDRRNEIEDYVIEYLKGLKKVAQDIIFVSDSDVKEEELSKISNYVTHTIVGHHGEYDFGSYKRGYLWADENNILKNYKELIFANDSCYGPIHPFEIMFKNMENSQADFWGATINDNKKFKTDEIRNHVQSFFVVYKHQVFNNECFKSFISSITKQNSKEEVISKYEIGLSIFLQEHGYKCDAFSKISKIIQDSQAARFKQMILKEQMPLLKRNVVLKKELKYVYPIGIRNLISKTDYDFKLIEKDRKRNMAKTNSWKEFCYLLKHFRRRTIRISFKNGNITLFNKITIRW